MRAMLINEQGCVFDEDTFSNVEDVREWAKGRGGTYQLRIIDDNGEVRHNFYVKNDRFYSEWFYRG